MSAPSNPPPSPSQRSNATAPWSVGATPITEARKKGGFGEEGVGVGTCCCFFCLVFCYVFFVLCFFVFFFVCFLFCVFYFFLCFLLCFVVVVSRKQSLKEIFYQMSLIVQLAELWGLGKNTVGLLLQWLNFICFFLVGFPY